MAVSAASGLITKTSKYSVQETIERLRSLGCSEVEDLETARENVVFTLPRELRAIAAAREPAERDREGRRPQ
jgi:hypothetical protein